MELLQINMEKEIAYFEAWFQRKPIIYIGETTFGRVLDLPKIEVGRMADKGTGMKLLGCDVVVGDFDSGFILS